MDFAVSEQVLEKTTKCEHDFSCLESGRCGAEPMCEADHASALTVLHLKGKSPASCSYRMQSLQDPMCTCPTRLAIYDKYGRQEGQQAGRLRLAR